MACNCTTQTSTKSDTLTSRHASTVLVLLLYCLPSLARTMKTRKWPYMKMSFIYKSVYKKLYYPSNILVIATLFLYMFIYAYFLKWQNR